MEYFIQPRDHRALTPKAALVDTLAGIPGLMFNVTASVHPGASRQALEFALRGWIARANRYYLGRDWLRRRDRHMRGVAFFERRPHNHAHMVVAPPSGASPLHFLLSARFWWVRSPSPEMSRLYRPGVAPRGAMMIQRIGNSRIDLIRVLNYNAKQLERNGAASDDWKMLADI